MRLRLYTVQLDPVSHEDDAGAVFLREGFSWGAALFTVLWAAWSGLWVWAAVLLVAEVAMIGVHVWMEAPVGERLSIRVAEAEIEAAVAAVRPLGRS